MKHERLRLKVLLRLVLVTLLLTAILAAAAPGLAGPATPISLQVEGPAAPVQVGQTFTVNIYANDAVNLGSFEFFFVFDSAVVETTSADVHLADFLGSTGRNTGELHRDPTPPDANRAIFGAYSYGSQSGPDGNGLLATVTTTAAGVGVSSLSLERLQVTDIDGTPVESLAGSGTVEVSAEGGNFPIYLPMLFKQSSR